MFPRCSPPVPTPTGLKQANWGWVNNAYEHTCLIDNENLANSSVRLKTVPSIKQTLADVNVSITSPKLSFQMCSSEHGTVLAFSMNRTVDLGVAIKQTDVPTILSLPTTAGFSILS